MQSGKATSKLNAPVKVEITPQTYYILRDAYLESIDRRLRAIIKPALEYFKELSPTSALSAILSNKTIKDYYPSGFQTKHRIALGLAKGYVRFHREVLDQLRNRLTSDFIMLLLKYENPEVYMVLEENVSKDKIEKWIKKNIDDLIDLITPKESE